MKRFLAWFRKPVDEAPAVIVMFVVAVVFVAGLGTLIITGINAVQTHSLIASGKTPAAVKLQTAASKDLELFCVVLGSKSVLENPKVSNNIKAVVRRDCDVKKATP